MLSEDFALVGTDRMTWDEFYRDYVINYKDPYFIDRTFYFRYKGREYQFDLAIYEGFKGSYKGKKLTKYAYVFINFGPNNILYEGLDDAICYDNFKEAVDNAKMEDGKTLKEILDDPDSEVIDFT